MTISVEECFVCPLWTAPFPGKVVLACIRNIQLLAENYVPAAKKYEKAVPEIQAMQVDIEIMKKVIAEHSEKLQRLA